MKKESHFFYVVLPFCVVVFFATMHYLKSGCPQCGFFNKLEDRYCLDCGKEMRPMTEDEMQKLAMEDKKVKERIVVKKNFVVKSVPSLKVDLDYEVLNYTSNSVDLLITAKNVSKHPIKYLLTRVDVKGHKKDSDVKTKMIELKDSVYTPLEHKETTTKKISVGIGGVRNVNAKPSDIKDYFKVKLEVVSVK